jgi:hypothetical protein
LLWGVGDRNVPLILACGDEDVREHVPTRRVGMRTLACRDEGLAGALRARREL